MSQAKVDRYKDQKKNRKQIMQKEKRAKRIRLFIGTLISVAVIGWIGVSGYSTYMDSRPREMATIDYAAVDEYLQGLQ